MWQYNINDDRELLKTTKYVHDVIESCHIHVPVNNRTIQVLDF